MANITHWVECATPLDFCWRYVSDYRNVPKWMLGVEKFEPIGDQSRGVGAVFDAHMDIGPMRLQPTVDVVEWVEDTHMGLHVTEKLVKATISLQLQSVDAHRCEVNIVTDYTVGKGIAGKLLDKGLIVFARLAIQHMDKHLTKQIESGYMRLSPESG